MATEQEFWGGAMSKEPEQRAAIDFKRIGYRALRYWYLIALSLMVALSIAFYKNRYTQRIYPVSASIIIREVEETTGGELLYKNALVDQYKNYLNEPYLIKSYPIIQKVVDELNFSVAFYKEGYFLTSESYGQIPVTARLVGSRNPEGGKCIFKIIDDNTYSLEIFGKEAVEKNIFHFGDTVAFGGYDLWIGRIKGRSVDERIGQPLLVAFTDPFAVASSYVSKLNVSWAEEGSGVLNLSVNGSTPAKEIDFLNGLVRNYQQYDLNKKNQAADRSIEFIQGQLSKISDSLKLFENQLQQFKKSNRTSGNLGMDAQRMFQRAETLEVQRAELLVKRNYYDYLEKYLGEDKNLDQVIIPTSLGITDPVLTSTVSKLVDLQLEIKLFLDKERELNPLVKSKLKRLGELKSEVIESIRSLKITDKIKLDFLDAQVSSAERQIGYLPLAERQLISIQRNYSLMETLYLFLMQKMSEAGISKASNVSDIIVVNPPMAGGAISPSTSTNYLIAVSLGLVIPFVIFVLLEILNNKVQSQEDISKLTTIPFVGGIGHNPILSNMIVKERPKSGVSESFRALRSNLNFFTGNESNKIFMITSSISGEGKTFTTINLATVFALSNKKTLIIGADMRRPKIFADFALSNEKGLSNYLSNLVSFDEIIQSTQIENLDLVSGGQVPPNPSELLLTMKFEEFLAEAKNRYDYILIDTPPLALVTDAFVIAKYVDHTVFVMRQNYTPKPFVMSINEYYRSGKFKNISILLNDIYKSGLGYGYGHGYSYGYGYGAYGYRSRSKENDSYYAEY